VYISSISKPLTVRLKTNTAPDEEPITAYYPFGEKQKSDLFFTLPEVAQEKLLSSNVLPIYFQVRTSHNFMVLSLEVVIIIYSSGVNLAQVIASS
jgi:hypothetical protein